MEPAGRGALRGRVSKGRYENLARGRTSATKTSRSCNTPAARPASAKGAVLTHRNLVANVLQAEAWFKPTVLPDEQQVD